MKFIRVTEVRSDYEYEKTSDGVFQYMAGSVLLVSQKDVVVFLNPDYIVHVEERIDETLGTRTFLVSDDDTFQLRESIEEVMLQIEGTK